MKVNQLFERFSDIDVTKDVKNFDKADKNDWFYDYALSFVVNKSVSRVYNDWKKKNPNRFPSVFLYDWKSIIADGKYNSGDILYQKRDSISEIEDLESAISWNSNNEPSIDTLDLSEVINNSEFKFTTPNFKFDTVEFCVLDENNLSAYPDWAPKKVKTLSMRHNNFTSLSNLDKNLKECEKIDLRGNPITSHILSVFKIHGLNNIAIDNLKVAHIVNKHLQSDDKDIFDCQEELIEAGLQDFAKL